MHRRLLERHWITCVLQYSLQLCVGGHVGYDSKVTNELFYDDKEHLINFQSTTLYMMSDLVGLVAFNVFRAIDE